MSLAPAFHSTMQPPLDRISLKVSRRSFLNTSAALAGIGPLLARVIQAQSRQALLMAYVGTFSSPLRDVLPTQADLSPGNGRGSFSVGKAGKLTFAVPPRPVVFLKLPGRVRRNKVWQIEDAGCYETRRPC